MKIKRGFSLVIVLLFLFILNSNILIAADPIGSLDTANCNYVSGWASDSDCPSTGIGVSIDFCNSGGTGCVYKTTIANLYRADVGNHAFTYVNGGEYPQDVKQLLCDGGSHIVRAYGINQCGGGPSVQLSASPKTVSGCGYYKEETQGTDAPAQFDDGTYECCTNTNYCVEGGTCYASGSTYGSVPNKGYCSSGSWLGGDSGSTACTAIGGTLFSSSGYTSTSSTYDWCCGDDGGSAEDWSAYTGTLTSSTTSTCRRCLNGADQGSDSLCGNGYFGSSCGSSLSVNTATSGTCFSGDITCTSSSASDGPADLRCGNGYFGSACGSSLNVNTATAGRCYYGNIVCSDGSSSDGTSVYRCGNGYFGSSCGSSLNVNTATSGTCYYGNIACSDGSSSNGASVVRYGNGYYSGSLVNSDTLECYYGNIACSDGSSSNGAVTTIYGNGYLSGSGNSRTCYYGDLSCSDGTSSNGASKTIYGWGYYTGDLSSDTTITCRSGAGVCSNSNNAGDSYDDSPSTLCGNGYFSSSNSACTSADKTSAVFGYCYYGDITCSDGSESKGAVSSIRYGNGYLSGSGSSRTCYYGDIVCSDGTSSNGASSTVYGWGYYTGDLTINTGIDCRSGPAACSDGTAISDSISLLRGNGYLTGSGTTRTCYYGDITCSDGVENSGDSATVYGWGYYSGNLLSDTTISCRSGAATCSDGTYSDAASNTLYGNGYFAGTSVLTDESGTCYSGDITCSDGVSLDGDSVVRYGNGYINGDTCYYGNITCLDSISDDGEYCTLDSNDICDDDVACLACDPYVKSTVSTCKSSCNSDSDCTTSYHCNGLNQCVDNFLNGQVCSNDNECESYNCDVDVAGVFKYCHQTSNGCVHFALGSPFEVSSGSVVNVMICDNSVWLNATPIYSDFDENLSFKINHVPEIVSVPNVALSNFYGRIEWNDNLDLAYANLNDNVKIFEKGASVNVLSLDSSFNSEANITLYGIDCVNFDRELLSYKSGFFTSAESILGNRCPDNVCTFVTCEGEKLNFTVSGFSGFAYGGNSNLTVNDTTEVLDVYPTQDVEIYAYYSNISDASSIDDLLGNCYVFVPSNSIENELMDYDSSEERWNYTTSFSTYGLMEYSVNCTSSYFTDQFVIAYADIKVSSVPEFTVSEIVIAFLAIIVGLHIFRKDNDFE